MNIAEKDVASLVNSKLSKYFGVTAKEATKEQAYKAVVMAIRDILFPSILRLQEFRPRAVSYKVSVIL